MRGARAYDDHLGLMARDFSGIRLVIFHGISGSGKSTVIERLADSHPEFRGRDRTHVAGPRIDWRQVRPATELVIVDECKWPRDLLGLAGLLRRGHRILAASHLPLFLSTLLGRIWPVVALPTDRDPGKIERYLETLGVRYSTGAVDAFCARFGASYDSVDLVMDFDGDRDFDVALERFLRCCRVRRGTAGSP